MTRIWDHVKSLTQWTVEAQEKINLQCTCQSSKTGWLSSRQGSFSHSGWSLFTLNIVIEALESRLHVPLFLSSSFFFSILTERVVAYWIWKINNTHMPLFALVSWENTSTSDGPTDIGVLNGWPSTWNQYGSLSCRKRGFPRNMGLYYSLGT